MSQSTRLRAARAALEAVVRSARASGQDTIAELAALGLDASGESDADAARRAADAARKRTARGHDAPSSGRLPESNGHDADMRGGKGGGVSSDLQRDPDHKTSPVGVQGEGRPDTLRIPHAVRNATDDGHFGLMLDAWLDGMRIATARPFTRPVQGAIRQLVEALRSHAPSDGSDPVEWARSIAGAYVASNRGRTLSSFAFVAWLDSGEPAGAREPSPPTPPADSERRQRIRDEASIRAQLEERLRDTGGGK